MYSSGLFLLCALAFVHSLPDAKRTEGEGQLMHLPQNVYDVRDADSMEQYAQFRKYIPKAYDENYSENLK